VQYTLYTDESVLTNVFLDPADQTYSCITLHHVSKFLQEAHHHCKSAAVNNWTLLAAQQGHLLRTLFNMVSDLNLGEKVSQFWLSLCWHLEVKVCLQLIHQNCSCVLLHKRCNLLQPVFLTAAAAAVHILQTSQIGYLSPQTVHALHPMKTVHPDTALKSKCSSCVQHLTMDTEIHQQPHHDLCRVSANAP